MICCGCKREFVPGTRPDGLPNGIGFGMSDGKVIDICTDCVEKLSEMTDEERDRFVTDAIKNYEILHQADETDLISRKEAMSHPFANGDYDKTNANEDFILGHESYKEWLETLPSVEPKARWIPVSERNPEKDGFYIATLDGEIAGEDEPFTGLAEFENGKWVDDEDDYQCIRAWMPLPEAYKEKNNGQKQ